MTEQQVVRVVTLALGGIIVGFIGAKLLMSVI